MPKGVLWRQADIYAGAMGGSNPATGDEHESIEAAVAVATEPRIFPYLIAAPLMHAAGHWLAFLAWAGGDPVVFPEVVDHLDAGDVLRTIEREGIAFIILVGNAFGRPLLDELDRGDYDLASLNVLATGGTAMTRDVKAAFLDHRPGLRIIDSIGSSESGTQGRHVSSAEGDIAAGVFWPGAGTWLLHEDLSGPLPVESVDAGWLARTGRIPLGYLGDAEKTAATFPLIDGVRWSVPGDRAHWRPDGSIQLLGRDSVCINTGGEKVFVEEVEAALHAHPDVVDAVVVGRPSERWGSEVVAIVDRGTSDVTAVELVAHCDGHLARYKLPKDVRFVAEVQRSPTGKPDYQWAAELAVEGDA
jgi:acyl-CoA synthetase (AMP-forming)/AMP-acid ligase II